MKQFIYLFTAILGLFIGSSADAGFYNGGTFQARTLNLSVGGTLENNGSLIGTEAANISCDTFAGNANGLLKSPQIVLVTDVFQYKGTIDCSEKCTLYVKEPFNEKMFKRKGKGAFEIVITGEQHAEISQSFGQTGFSIDCCLID